MRARFMICWCACAFVAAAEADGEVRLRVLAAGICVDEPPALTIGGVSRSSTTGLEQLGDAVPGALWPPNPDRTSIPAGWRAHLIDASADNRIGILVSHAGEWRPRCIVRKGRELVVHGDGCAPGWALSNAPAKRRLAFLLDAGQLHSGEHTVRLEIAWRVPMEERSPWHVQRSTLRASAALTVPGGTVASGPVAEDQVAGDADPWLPPLVAERRLPADSAIPTGLIAMRSFDDRTFPEATIGADGLPPPAGRGGGRSCAIVAGPVLDSYESVAVRSIARRDGRIVITIAVFQDTGGRDKNVPSRPHLAIPVPGMGRDEPIEVRWVHLEADRPDGIYRERPARPEP